MATIQLPLTRGQFAIVDAADIPLLDSAGKWHAHKSARGRTWYACGQVGGRKVAMHRLLMGCTHGDGIKVDHWDGDGLNNTRSNIRLATHADNQRNQAKTRGTSRFKGVSWHKAGCKWEVVVRMNGRNVYFGLHADESDAARVYNLHAARLFGLFCRLNEVN